VGADDTLERSLRDAAASLRARLPRRISIAFRPLSEAYFRTTARGGELRVVVNDALEDAPGGVLDDLALVIVARASGAARPREVGERFWAYTATPSLRERMERNYLARQRSFSPDPRGGSWDLEELFDRVNSAHFDDALERPMLGWTRRPVTHRWGWYSSMVRPNGLIVINRLLDDPLVPAFVLEGTLYHEMLHMLMDTETVGGRRVVHTRRFREMERRFPDHDRLRSEYRKVLSRYAGRFQAQRRRGRGGR